MKKIYGFLGAAALLMMVGCSKDEAGGAQTPESTGGDMFMSMTIAPKGSTGTRAEAGTGTTTPGQGKEVGKDSENKISDGLLIFTKKDEQTYKVFTSKAILGTEIEGVSPYVATFELDRDTFVEDVTTNTTYYLFFIANANECNITVTPNTDVQQVLEEKVIGDITKANNFLMTNAELCKVELSPADVAVGTHTTKAEALQLGTVKVQRAMSRIDIDIEHVAFTQEDEEAFLKDITVTFDGVALVNEATSMNLFKVVANNDTNLPTMTLAENSGQTWGAPAETATNYVFSPVQTSWTSPLFGTGVVDSGNANKWMQGNMKGDQKDLSSFSYTSIANLSTEDNPFYYPASSSSAYDAENYYIWRYCMENTNYDKDNQLNGNSTGIIFRAEITGSKIEEKEDALYAYNSIIIGDGQDLYTYVNGADPNDGLWSTIKSKYADAIAAVGDEWDADAAAQGTQDWSVLDERLVKFNQFTIYRPDSSDGKYYCYYMYWNRHNNNNNNTVMGPMEFATVRNNVYKLKVNSIARLGHPADPDDDPDPNDPEDPNEKDQFYAQIECVVLDWEVRINGIDF